MARSPSSLEDFITNQSGHHGTMAAAALSSRRNRGAAADYLDPDYDIGGECMEALQETLSQLERSMANLNRSHLSLRSQMDVATRRCQNLCKNSEYEASKLCPTCLKLGIVSWPKGECDEGGCTLCGDKDYLPGTSVQAQCVNELIARSDAFRKGLQENIVNLLAEKRRLSAKIQHVEQEVEAKREEEIEAAKEELRRAQERLEYLQSCGVRQQQQPSREPIRQVETAQKGVDDGKEGKNGEEGGSRGDQSSGGTATETTASSPRASPRAPGPSRAMAGGHARCIARPPQPDLISLPESSSLPSPPPTAGEEVRPIKVRLQQTGRQECGICESRQCNTALVPCGHQWTCEDCAKSLTACPLCRKEILFKLRVYRS